MIRIVFSLFFWALVGRWAYSEVNLVFPSATPVIDFALTKLQIPTHDQWDAKSIHTFISNARGMAQNTLADAGISTTSHNKQLANANIKEVKAVSRTIAKSEIFSRF